MIFKILLPRSVQTPNSNKNWQTSCPLQTFMLRKSTFGFHYRTGSPGQLGLRVAGFPGHWVTKCDPVPCLDSNSRGGSTLGPGGHRPLQIVATPPNLAVLLTPCGQLLLRKISKSDDNRCEILRLECTKFDFRWGSAHTLRQHRPTSPIQWTAFPALCVEKSARLNLACVAMNVCTRDSLVSPYPQYVTQERRRRLRRTAKKKRALHSHPAALRTSSLKCHF